MIKFSEMEDGMYLEREFKRLYNKVSNEAKESFCFNESEECSKEIKRAHSIQNNKILNQLSENGDVLYIVYGDGELKFEKVGRNKATTFTGFCGYHDSKIFSPIEDSDFIPNNEEQEFLFAYRIIAKEYHAKLQNRNISQRLIEEIENIQKNIFNDYELENKKNEIKQWLKCVEYDIRDLEKYKKMLNKSLKDRNFKSIKTYCLELDTSYGIAVASWCYPIKDLKGKIINDTSNLNKRMKPLMVTIFPQNNKTYILLSYFNNDEYKYKRFINQLESLKYNQKKVVISNIIISDCENFVYSPKYWDQLSERKKQLISEKFDYVNRSNHEWFDNNELNLFEDIEEKI